MSGASYDTDCARCGGKGTIMACSDWKPHDMVSGDCLKCGYTYWTATEVLTSEELKSLRKNYQYKNKGLTAAERMRIAKYDKVAGVKKRSLNLWGE